MEMFSIGKSHIMSRPTAGRTMLGLLRTQGSLLHQAHTILKDYLELDIINNIDNEWLTQYILFRFEESDKCLIAKEKSSLISQSLILNWICGRITSTISNQDDILDAEIIFNTFSNGYFISKFITPQINKSVVEYLKQLDVNTLLDTLPYLVEVFDTGAETAEAKGIERVRKKKNGIYYTPTDVIEFIVNRSISIRSDSLSSIEEFKWFDPALGTGSFLLSVLKHQSSINNLSDNNILSYFKHSLFGTDISPFALQSASYIFATHCLLKEKGLKLQDAARLIGINLVLKDSTKVNTKDKLYDLFPNIGKDGADFIVSNPPYSKKLQLQLNLFDKGNGESDNGEELYPDFIKFLFELTNKKNGGGGMVVPLSLSASSKERFRNLRSYIQSKDGLIEFWNFDRTPDSLFGDDVKTRNTIIFYNHFNGLPTKINTSYLHRWSSRNRANLFDSVKIATLSDKICIKNGIPKIGDQVASEILGIVSRKEHGTLKEVLRRTESKTELRTKTTAYNWLPVELNSSDQPESTIGRIYWESTSDVISSTTIYSILNSRFVYWLWRVWGDGFHVTSQFIYDLPFGNSFFKSINKTKLQDLGFKLWNNVQKELVVSKNAGLVSHSYSPLASFELVDEIDKLLIDYYGFENISVDYLKEFVHELVISGRYSENKTMNKIKYIKQQII